VFKKIPVLKELITLLYTVKLLHSQYFNVTIFSNYGMRHKTSIVRTPCYFDPQYVYLHEQTRLSNRTRVISSGGKFIMKKYSLAAVNLLVVTGNHTPTVGIPSFIMVDTHINDKEVDIVVEEDVWIGANVTLIPGAYLSRGVVCGAGCIVNRRIPPYAVVVGTPAKIIASKFSINQILEHEKALYEPSERFSEEFLEELFEDIYKDKRSIGLDSMSNSDRKKLELFRSDFQI
jgi:virginiamycin A acetyltransferase